MVCFPKVIWVSLKIGLPINQGFPILRAGVLGTLHRDSLAKKKLFDSGVQRVDEDLDLPPVQRSNAGCGDWQCVFSSRQQMQSRP